MTNVFFQLKFKYFEKKKKIKNKREYDSAIIADILAA